MIDMRLAGMPRELPDASWGGMRAEESTASPDRIDAHVGQRLRKRRIELGLSQGALGRHLGLTFSQVQKYEKGTNRIGAGRLYHLASFLQVPIQYFFEGLDDTTRGPSWNDDGAAVDAARIQEVCSRISDPDARQALLALASSMTSG